ncbi:MAG TPA: Crp/Fnr family transcriptional regulator [Mucilaginibacter sp.]|jgi:CRP-like cAMP-binding protein
MEKLRSYIHSLIDLSEEAWNVLNPALTTAEYKKGHYLLQEGQVSNNLFFISTGYCRAFYKKGDQEINTNFFFESEIATNIESFYTGEKSGFSIQACENITTVMFDKPTLLLAGQENLEIATLGRLCMNQTATKLENHANLFKLMTAQERYEYLEKHYPMMLQRVPLNQLSSYLGIARETISRIRGRRS